MTIKEHFPCDNSIPSTCKWVAYYHLVFAIGGLIGLTFYTINTRTPLLRATETYWNQTSQAGGSYNFHSESSETSTDLWNINPALPVVPLMLVWVKNVEIFLQGVNSVGI
ncbi:hypothetical protein Fcan01_20936 [Folsomia candida]|uniref:Uncharacterized protein n=1 Tax=Folsomia candida TaxID=158441 RepID=A0A226DHD4_FOLCA|nr:hypothetical protein Fcan01_20936 [Folsomia candida]